MLSALRKGARHPIRAIREPFGTAGLIVACVALIAALGGTALAAAKLNGTQKKEVEKIAKKFAGKPGAAGTQGPAGATGAKGDTGSPGANGDAGATGTSGTNGTNGINGTSVTNTALAAANGSGHCEEEGGAKFQVGTGTATYACNGQTGFTATLPPGEQETGMWGYILPKTEEAKSTLVPISFAIPLAAHIDNAFYFDRESVEEEEFEGGCRWEVEEFSDGDAQPESTVPGTLCVFVAQEFVTEGLELVRFFNPGSPLTSVAGPTGGYLQFVKGLTVGPRELTASGVWVVSAPAA